MLPVPPQAFPVPSHASRAYLGEATSYLRMMAKALAPLVYPHGPIALVQIDNEGALFFRDGAYDQDYHPDAIELYRRFVERKYGSIGAVRERYGPVECFASLRPPTGLDPAAARGLARQLDWVEFQEEMIVEAFGVFRQALAAGGLAGVPTTHNLPMLQETTPLNAARLAEVVDAVGLDFYGRAGEAARVTTLRRTTELALHCEARDVPLFACEMGAGYPPYFPPLSEADSAFTVLTAMAYGVRGFNVFMAVERDRWIGAPIDRRGRARPFADFWRTLCNALERTSFHRLRRQVPVRLLIPRTERRLARALHAFGPITGAVLAVAGAGPREGCRELELQPGAPLVVQAEPFARAVEQALDRRGVSFAWVGGEHGWGSCARARWIICASSGACDPELLRQLDRARAGGARITFGPRRPRFDGGLRPLGEHLPQGLGEGAELWPEISAAGVGEAVGAAVAALELPTLCCEPDHLRMTVHEDESGQPQVVFVINGSDQRANAAVPAVAPVRRAVNLLSGATIECRAGRLAVEVEARSVLMLALG